MRHALCAAGLLLAVIPPTGLTAQVRDSSPRDVAEEAEVAYDVAKEQHELDIARLESIRYEWDQLIAELTAARTQGDDKEVRRLMGLLQERTGEKDQAEFAFRASREVWTETGRSLVGALNNYLHMLDNQTPVGSDDEANNLYNQYEARLRELEEELPEENFELKPMREVKIEPGDSPREIRHKRNLLTRRVDELTEVLADLDRDIERDTQRQRREKRRRDREADLARFGDNENPTGGNRANLTGDAGVAMDPLEERIAKMNRFREQVEKEVESLRRRLLEEFGSERGGS